MLADVLLRDQQRFIADSDPSFVAPWLWHAVEETEHKAVCFDVYQHVFGKGVFSYLLRVLTMANVSITFIGVLGIAFTWMKWKKPRNGELGAPTLAVLLHDVPLRMYFDYYRFSFHPWRHDNSALIDQWKAHFRDFGVAPDARAGGADVQ